MEGGVMDFKPPMLYHLYKKVLINTLLILEAWVKITTIYCLMMVGGFLLIFH